MCGNFMGRIFILKYEVIRKGKTARQNRPGDLFSGLHRVMTLPSPFSEREGIFVQITKRI
jgi:hypothetical protein